MKCVLFALHGVLAALVIGGWASAAAVGQVSTDDAYRQMQARAAARAAPQNGHPAPAPKSDSKKANETDAPPKPAVVDSRPAVDPNSELVKARLNVQTALRDGAEAPAEHHRRPPDPGLTDYSLVKFPAPPGDLWAYLTADPDDGKRHPAVLWIHGGFAGLSGYLLDRDQPADNDQTPWAFVDAKFVVMCPSFRGHNDNPGKFEMFYGEVDDAAAAVDYLSKLPYVDPNRIYVVGHSTGGTMALLLAETSGKLRAAFSLCGCSDVAELTSRESDDHHNAPFDWQNTQETRLRSAVNFVGGLQTPTFFFDQRDSMYAAEAEDMYRRAATAGAPFQAFIIEQATHTDIVRPITRMLAAKLQADTDQKLNVSISPQDIAAAYASVFTGRHVDVSVPLTIPALTVTPVCRKAFDVVCKSHQLDPKVAALAIVKDGGSVKVAYTASVPSHSPMVFRNFVRVMIQPDALPNLRPGKIDFVVLGTTGTFQFVPDGT